MEKIGNVNAESGGFGEGKWTIANCRSMRTCVGYTYHEVHTVINRIAVQKNMVNIDDDDIYRLYGSDGSSMTCTLGVGGQ